ncbi:hypothetical protein P0F26_002974 [Vibrio metschnikovii]|nr:hypothetical protein [Vibrio metschnikovii]
MNKSRSVIPLGYFLLLQFLLIGSYWLGVEDFGGMSDIPSYYRPIMLMVITLAFLILMDDYKSVYESTLHIIRILVFLVFLYSVFEVFAFDVFSSFFHAFYRLEDKDNIDGVAVSFFTLPYYSAYILNTFFIFLLSEYNKGKSFKSFIYVLFCILSIFLAQSKMGIALCVAILFAFYFMQSRIISKSIILSIFFVFMMLLYFYLYDFVLFMKKEYGGHLFTTLYVMMAHTEQSGNLMERVSDIYDTYRLIENNNYFIGVGLGKGVTIETWIASLMYRYGLLGLGFFIAAYLFVGFYSWYLSSKESDFYRSELLKICSIWALTLFISQLSGFMMEVSKSAVVSCFMLALVTFSLNKNKSPNVILERNL